MLLINNLLLDIISKTSALNIGVKSINTITNVDYDCYDLNILVENIDDLNKYISIISQLKYVNSVERGNK